jgi:hypothetical protein
MLVLLLGLLVGLEQCLLLFLEFKVYFIALRVLFDGVRVDVGDSPQQFLNGGQGHEFVAVLRPDAQEVFVVGRVPPAVCASILRDQTLYLV